MSKLRLNSLQNPDSSAVNIELTSTGGAVVSGILTASTIDGGTITATNLTVEGTITYDDVTNVDSVGVITARNGIDVNAGGIDVTAGGINAVGIVTATSFSGEDYLLSAIDTSITDTAVDIFVYDTSKDSDGGAWRKRTQHTSWYNETLNTATRGSRKEFPAVAVIVVTAATTRKLYIYDGDDPNLPMWMVIDSSDGQWPQAEFSSLYALNGIIALGSASNTQPLYETRNRLDLYYFVSDKIESSGAGTGGNYYGTVEGLVNRRTHATNRGSTVGNSVYPLVNLRVNDVAMTVLSNRSIDSDTELPIPTVAVATDGGVSVIRDDGSVFDISHSTTLQNNFVHFIKSNLLTFSQDNADTYKWTHFVPVTNIDRSQTYNYNNPQTNWYANWGNYGSNDIIPATPIGSANAGYTAIVPMGPDMISFGSSYGLGLRGTLENSPPRMIAHVGSSYNTGYMVGKIKGAFLSDTDATNVTGGNIVTNGDTWTGASSSTSSTPPNGWTGGNAAQWRTATGGDGSYIRLVNAGSSQGGPNSYMYQAITTVPGRKYKISLTQYHHATISVYYSVGTSINGGDLVTDTWVSSISNTPRDEHNTFTATGTTTYLTLGITSGTNNYDTGWDNVVITEVVDDRSSSVNGLHSFGTITKSAVATGAELVAYSGFSGSNVLVQPYNSDLDPGTGDYSFICWFKCSSTGGEQMIMRRFGVPTVTGGMMMRLVASTSTLQWYVRDTSSSAATIQSPNAVDDDNWHCAVGTREGSTANLYLDGVLVTTQTCSANSHDPGTTADLVIGAEENSANPGTYQNPADLCSLTLVRYSLSAPSAEQVKKMYEDEKVLFQENAKCTLYGSSDGVTAMAYDEVTETLHVGTSAGRSDFQGLRRINNTTTAVTTAISASGELIAEQ